MLLTAKLIYIFLLLLTLYILFSIIFILPLSLSHVLEAQGKWSEIILNWGIPLTLKVKSELLLGILLSRNKFLSGTKKQFTFCLQKIKIEADRSNV